jgi:hypothetical protein
MNLLFKLPVAIVLSGILSSFTATAQSFDTLQVMTYNLTNYGNTIDACSTSTNGPALKNPEFKTIIKHVMPDILGVCEMNTNPAYATNFMNNVLNTDGVTHYKKSNQQVEPAGTLTSILYYNSEKLVLNKQSYASTSPRLTHHFRLYLKTEQLANGDTIWINVMAGHLKAGNTASDATDRANSATTIRNYLNGLSKKENCLILGDFNLYRSSEVAFQTLTAPGTKPTYQFQDPVNRVGSWTINSAYSDVHTQCPSLNYNSGCYSGGGLDDRFDFILMNRHLLNDSAGLKYITGTYKALGNDGSHYNKSVTDSPTNNSAPSAVLQSLYKASDHLPVIARLRVTGTFITATKPEQQVRRFDLEASGDHLLLQGVEDGIRTHLLFTDVNGKILWEGEQTIRDSQLLIPTEVCGEGLTFVQCSTENHFFSSLKFLRIKY